MVNNLMLKEAIEIAVDYHAKQVDKSGDLYVLHPLRVMSRFETTEERIIAVLHDIIEDTPVTEGYLLGHFPKDIVDDIVCLSKKHGETYAEFLVRIKENERATRVKIADIQDNMSFVRLAKLPEEQRARLTNKYTNALLFLRFAKSSEKSC